MNRSSLPVEASIVDRETFDLTIQNFKHRRPYRPFTVALMNGDRVEIDHPEAFIIRDGVALFAGPGGVPWVFDHEGVTQIIGDLASRSGNASGDA